MSLSSTPMPVAPAPRLLGCDRQTIDGLIDQLAASDGPAGDGERIDMLGALERLKGAVEGLQAEITARFVTSQRAAAAEAGTPRDRQDRGIGHQIGLARRESPHRGRTHTQLAMVLRNELPHTMRALRSGRTSEYAATMLARETACLSAEHRAIVDEQLAGDPDRIERLGPLGVAAQARVLAAELDPAGVVERRRRAETERHVSIRPAPDAMSWIRALVPAADGVGVFAALKSAADHATGTGDPRSRGQIMADTLVERVTGRPARVTGRPARVTERPPKVTGRPDGQADAPAAPGSAGPASVRITINLVMTDHQLFGTGPASEGSAHLDGFGPIDVDLARQLAEQADEHADQVWIRRLFTDPVTGELTDLDQRSRYFPHRLRDLIRLRDQQCRTPWCHAPIRHIDHISDHANGGSTSLTNGQGLCEACNHAKQAAGWHTYAGPDSAVTTITPTGHVYTSRPPPPPGRRPPRVDHSPSERRLRLDLAYSA